MAARVGVLASGRGSNLEALIAAAGREYRIVFVGSNNEDAGALHKARAAQIPFAAIDHRPFGKDRQAHERALDAAMRAHEVEFVALAGYMRILTPYLVRAWAGRMINIHPSLLPLFPGLDTHARAIAAGMRVHGCTVHWVTEGVDEGGIIGQAAVPILPMDDPETLAQRVLGAEHRLYPACLAMVAAGAEAQVEAGDMLASAWLSRS
jgi:phosphoribosylglycinamide formyltransferase-1